MQLIHGDCLELMKNIPDKSIDMVLTDPPYGIDYSDWDVFHNNTNKSLGKQNKNMEEKGFKRTGKPLNGWNKKDRTIGDEYKNFLNNWFLELYRLVKDASPVLIFSSRRFLHKVVQSLEDSGFIIKDILIWEKNKCHAKAQRINKVLENRDLQNKEYDDYRLGNLKPMYEPIIYAFKPYKKTITDCFIKDKVGGFNCVDGKMPENIFKVPIEKSIYHENQKPIELLEILIKIFSFKNKTILDFTMGSGSTGVACINTGRNFIGIEKDDKYFKIAQKRIEEAKNKQKYKLF